MSQFAKCLVFSALVCRPSRWYFPQLLIKVLRRVIQKIWDWITDLWSPSLPVCFVSSIHWRVTGCGMGWGAPLFLRVVGLRWWPESSRGFWYHQLPHYTRPNQPLCYLLKQRNRLPWRGYERQSYTESYFPTMKSGLGKEAVGFVPVPVCQWELFLLWGGPSWQPSLWLVPRVVPWLSLASQLSFPRAEEWELLGIVPL